MNISNPRLLIITRAYLVVLSLSTESQIADIPQVSQEENDLLTAPYLEEEVKKAVFQMEHNKALGPDGFHAKFC
jgi:hypothetical protein